MFEQSLEVDREWFALPVNYQSRRPRVNLTRMSDPEVMKNALFLKNQHWSYEKEHRMFDWNIPPGYRPFPAKALKGVILGAKISSADEDFILQLARKRDTVKVLRAQIDPIDFRININDA